MGIGWSIALVVLILSVVFMALGTLTVPVGGLLAGLAIARMVP